jgi:cytochrome c oxidase subunit 3
MRFLFISNTVLWFKYGFSNILTIFCISLTVVTFTLWFRDINRERAYQGQHTSTVQRGLKWGLIWFLFREVWFFFRVFWAFFHIRLSPLSIRIIVWPRLGLEPIPAFQVPLLNTIILLIRGVTATLAHQEILKGSQNIWIFVRGGLGVYFLTLQGIEYYQSTFNISSRVYGRVFFFGTGFHGLHVCLGIIILITRALRILLNTITRQHHFSLEFRLWYWHFVDVVWLFLFFWVYAWGC